LFEINSTCWNIRQIYLIFLGAGFPFLFVSAPRTWLSLRVGAHSWQIHFKWSLIGFVAARRFRSLRARANDAAAPGPKRAVVTAIDPIASGVSHSVPTFNIAANGAWIVVPCCTCKKAKTIHVSVTTCQSNCVNKCAPSTRMTAEDCPTLLGDGMNKRWRERSGSEEVSETHNVYYRLSQLSSN